MAANKPKKNQALKNNEYYNTQALFDDLYERSQRGEISTHLMELIASEQNILLAYRAIKKNKGSKTKGTNSTTIVEMGEKQPEEKCILADCLCAETAAKFSSPRSPPRGNPQTGWAYAPTGHSHHGRPYHSAVYQASAGANLRSKIL